MSPFRLAKRLLAFLMEVVRGPRTTEEIVTPRTRSERLTGYSVSGFVINIHCQERRYRIRYRRWYVPNKELRLYHIFATTTDDCPDRLMEACRLDAVFPMLLSDAVSEQKQQAAVISAYLDILITRLETSVVFSA